MSDTCPHGRGQTVRCRRCERERAVPPGVLVPGGDAPLCHCAQSVTGSWGNVEPGRLVPYAFGEAIHTDRDCPTCGGSGRPRATPSGEPALPVRASDLLGGRMGMAPFRFSDALAYQVETGRGQVRLPVAPDRAVSSFTTHVVRARMAAIEALLARSREAAAAHCGARPDHPAAYPILRTDGANPVEGVERLEVCCGACQTPVDGLLFSARLQIGDEALAPDPEQAA